MDKGIPRWWSRVFVVGVGLALLGVLGAILPAVRETRGAPLAAAVPVSATGANAAAIQATVDAYRATLGTLNPPKPAASAAGGARSTGMASPMRPRPPITCRCNSSISIRRAA
jgi:hypothetical protein